MAPSIKQIKQTSSKILRHTQSTHLAGDGAKHVPKYEVARYDTYACAHAALSDCPRRPRVSTPHIPLLHQRYLMRTLVTPVNTAVMCTKIRSDVGQMSAR